MSATPVETDGKIASGSATAGLPQASPDQRLPCLPCSHEAEKVGLSRTWNLVLLSAVWPSAALMSVPFLVLQDADGKGSIAGCAKSMLSLPAPTTETVANTYLGTLAAGGVIWTTLLVVLFFHYGKHAARSVLVCLTLVLAEGWLDVFHLNPANRVLVLMPVVLNLALSWAAICDSWPSEMGYIRNIHFDEKDEKGVFGG